MNEGFLRDFFNMPRAKPDRWEYRFFNVGEGVVMEALARQGAHGWEAFQLDTFTSIGGNPAVRIYCKRRLA